MDQVLEKLLLANIKGYLRFDFHSAYTQYTQNNPISPNKGPTKNFFKQNLNIYA